MKTNKLIWMAVVLLPLMFLCTACNEDVSDEDWVVTIKVRNTDNGGTQFRIHDRNIYITLANNFESYNGEFVDVGTKRISQIKKIPTQGWASEVAVYPGHGYIFRTRESYWDGNMEVLYGEYMYGRIYVIDYIESTGGGIIGAEIQYKESSMPGVLD